MNILNYEYLWIEIEILKYWKIEIFMNILNYPNNAKLIEKLVNRYWMSKEFGFGVRITEHSSKVAQSYRSWLYF